MLTGCILITGTSRGIGLELAKQLVARKKITPRRIIATCRDPDNAPELQELSSANPDTVIIKKLDVTDYDGLDNFVNDIKVRKITTFLIYLLILN